MKYIVYKNSLQAKNFSDAQKSGKKVGPTFSDPLTAKSRMENTKGDYVWVKNGDTIIFTKFSPAS